MKQKTHYQMTWELIYEPAIGYYPSHGVAALEDGKPLRWLPDLSTDGTRLEQFVEQMNAAQVSLCHMENVLLDWLEGE